MSSQQLLSGPAGLMEWVGALLYHCIKHFLVRRWEGTTFNVAVAGLGNKVLEL